MHAPMGKAAGSLQEVTMTQGEWPGPETAFSVPQPTRYREKSTQL